MPDSPQDTSNASLELGVIGNGNVAALIDGRGRIASHICSAAMCWAACDPLLHVATELKLDDRAPLGRADRAAGAEDAVAERCKHWNAMMAVSRRNDITAWRDAFLQALRG